MRQGSLGSCEAHDLMTGAADPHSIASIAWCPATLASWHKKASGAPFEAFQGDAFFEVGVSLGLRVVSRPLSSCPQRS